MVTDDVILDFDVDGQLERRRARHIALPLGTRPANPQQNTQLGAPRSCSASNEQLAYYCEVTVVWYMTARLALALQGLEPHTTCATQKGATINIELYNHIYVCGFCVYHRV